MLIQLTGGGNVFTCCMVFRMEAWQPKGRHVSVLDVFTWSPVYEMEALHLAAGTFCTGIFQSPWVLLGIPWTTI